MNSNLFPLQLELPWALTFPVTAIGVPGDGKDSTFRVRVCELGNFLGGFGEVAERLRLWGWRC